MIHEVLEDVQGALNAGASEAAVLRVLHAYGFPWARPSWRIGWRGGAGSEVFPMHRRWASSYRNVCSGSNARQREYVFRYVYQSGKVCILSKGNENIEKLTPFSSCGMGLGRF